MSLVAITWAISCDVPDSTTKLTLLMLADKAGDDDRAWPKVSTLMGEVQASRSTIMRSLKWLEAEGLITREQGFERSKFGGMRKTNSVYQLMIPDKISRARVRDHHPQEVRPLRGVVGWDESRVTGDTTDDRCVTGDTSVVSWVTQRTREEPSPRNPSPPNPPLPASAATPGQDGQGREDSDESTTADPVDPPTREPRPLPDDGGGADWDLVRQCLPEPMQVLDDVGAARLTPTLTALTAGGWSARQVRNHLQAQPLPEHVHSMAGLVCARLRRLTATHPPTSHDATPPPPTITAAEARRRAWLDDLQAQAKHRQQLAQARALIRAARISQDVS